MTGTEQAETVKYETRTVKCVRGMEARTAAKWEADGWEVVSQTTGKVSSELTIRRPKPKTPWVLIGSLFGGVAVLILVIVIVGAVTGGNSSADSDPAESPSQSAPAEESPEPSESEAPAPERTEGDGPLSVITIDDPDFAALLAGTDTCAPEIAAFAEAHADEYLEFDGYVGAMNSHEGASTRYDILLGGGDFSETSAAGPTFQYRDVNTTNDLNWADGAPDSIGVGDNLHFVSQVVEFEESSCLFLLEPIKTAAR